VTVWDRARQLIRTARELGPLPRRLIQGLSRRGKGAAVTPTAPRIAPLAKFTVSFSYRAPGGNDIEYDEVLEVSPPDELIDNDGELGRWIQQRYYGGRGFVMVQGVERRAQETPTEPRLSLPRALPELRKDPATSAIRALNDLPARGRKWYGYVTLDLDDVRADRRAIRAWAKRVGMRRAFEYRSSASGAGSHVRFKIREGVSPRTALALREALGDDPIRAAIDSSRYAYSGRSAVRGVLFDRKGAERAGAWVSSAKPSRRRPMEETARAVKPKGTRARPRTIRNHRARSNR